MADIVKVNGLFLFWRSWPSNWTASPFIINKQEFGCVEQYMMAEKAAIFGDMETYHKILGTPIPSEQKKLGRQVKGYVEGHWVEARYGVVLRATLEKYRQNPELKEKLLDTGDLIMVEASPEDKVWGIGLEAHHPDAANPKLWKGENLLGKAVTNAREIIKYESKSVV